MQVKTNIKNITEEYDGLASDYDLKWKSYLKSTHEVALQLTDPHPHDVILDVSGGTGLLAEKIMKRMGKKGKMTITDVSEEMLKIVIKRLKEYKKIQILKNDVHHLTLNSKQFSKIVSVSALHYYTNPKKALSEFYRVLQPKGSLIIVDWCRDKFHFKIYDGIMKLLHKSHVKTYTSNELQQLLIEKGFKIDKTIKWSYGLWSLMGMKAVKR